jgi:methionyl-tRNA formyltransferase
MASSARAPAAEADGLKARGGWPNAPGVARLSVGMMFLFIAFQECQNVFPLLLEEAGFPGLGAYAMACYSSASAAAVWISRPIFRRIHPRVVLPVTGASGSAFVASMGVASMLAGAVPAWSVVALVAATTLLAAPISAVLWPAQGYILTHYAPTSMLNWYQSFFQLCFTSSGLLGPVIVSALLPAGGWRLATPALLLVAALGVLLLSGLPAPQPNSGAPQEPELCARDSGDEEAPSPQADADALQGGGRAIFSPAEDRRAVHLGAISFFEGLCLNSFVSMVTPEVVAAWSSPDDTLENKQERLQWALVQNGLGHLVASIVYAPIANRFGRRFVFGCQIAALLASMTLDDLELYLGPSGLTLQTSDLPFVLPGTFLLGLGIVLARIGNFTLTSLLYPDCAAAAFGFTTTLRMGGSVLGFLVLPLVPEAWAQWAVLFCVGGLALASWACMLHAPLFEGERPEADEAAEGTPSAAAELPQAAGTGLRIVILSNQPLCLEAVLPQLAERGYQVLAVFSAKPEIADLCRQRGVPFAEFPACSDAFSFMRCCKEDPDYNLRVEAAYEAMRALVPEVMLTIGFYVLPQQAISIPCRAAINFHPADLPLYRGALPLQAMILGGEASFKVCCHQLTETIDDPNGILSVSQPVPIYPLTDNFKAVFARTLAALPDVVGSALQRVEARGEGKASPLAAKAAPLAAEAAPLAAPPQSAPHSFAIKLVDYTDPATGQVLKSNVGVLSRVRVEWSEDTASDVERAARAFAGTFGTYTDYEGLPWKIECCSLPEELPVAGRPQAPGTVLEVERLEDDVSRVRVATVDGQTVTLTGRFTAAAAEVEAGKCFESRTPISSFLGISRRADRVVGAPRYA